MPFPESYVVATNDTVKAEDHNSHTRDITAIVAGSVAAFGDYSSVDDVKTTFSRTYGSTVFTYELYVDPLGSPFKLKVFKDGVLASTVVFRYDFLGYFIKTEEV